MPKLAKNRLPAYRRHKASGQAVVTLNGTDHYLGPHGTHANGHFSYVTIAEYET